MPPLGPELVAEGFRGIAPLLVLDWTRRDTWTTGIAPYNTFENNHSLTILRRTGDTYFLFFDFQADRSVEVAGRER